GPRGLVLDLAGNLYVAEDDNSRVLEFDDPLPLPPNADIIASRVFGQLGFNTATCSVGPSSLCHPDEVALGRFGQLIVTDKDNNRVLVFDNPLTNNGANQMANEVI